MSLGRVHHQQGIALGPILFIIAVLAILAAAIAAGSGGFVANTNTEGGKVNASTIIQIAGQLQEAVQKVMSHGCADTQVNFNNPIISGYSNPNAHVDGSCDVFGPNGGSMSFPMITASTLETADGAHWVFEGSGCARNYGNCNLVGVGQLVAYLPIDNIITCQQINSQVGMSGRIGLDWYSMPSDANYGHFTGTYNYNNRLADDGGNWIQGNTLMACAQEGYNNISPYRTGVNGTTAYPQNANYFFYAVLLIR